MQGLSNQPGPAVLVSVRILHALEATDGAAAAAADDFDDGDDETGSSSSRSRTDACHSSWGVFDLPAGLQEAAQQHDGASVTDCSFFRHPATLTVQDSDHFTLQADALPDAEAVEAAVAALCLQNSSSSSSSNARDGGDVSSQAPPPPPPPQQLQQWRMEEPEHCDPTVFVVEIPLKGLEDSEPRWNDTKPIWQLAAQQVLTRYACSSSSSQDPAAAAQGSAAAGFSTLPAWQQRLADVMMKRAEEVIQDYLELRMVERMQEMMFADSAAARASLSEASASNGRSSSQEPFSLQQPLLIVQLPSSGSGIEDEDEATTDVAAAAPVAAAAVADHATSAEAEAAAVAAVADHATSAEAAAAAAVADYVTSAEAEAAAAAAVADHATSAEAEAAAAAAVADYATSAEAEAAAVLSGSTTGSKGALRSYRRLVPQSLLALASYRILP